MLLAYKLKLGLCQNLPKVQIFHPYIIDALTLFSASSHPIIASALKFLKLILVAPATNINSMPFPWLVLNRFRKICLSLQCVRVAVCSTVFFHKSKFAFETRKNVFPRNF